MKPRWLALCGMAAPLLFIFTIVLGGLLRPGYSHLADTASELFAPGSPNKPLLDVLHTLFALLLTLFGLGLARFVRRQQGSNRIGLAGAILFLLAGLASITTATIFPQDPLGSTPTFAGRMHQNMSGVVALSTVASMLLLGTWFRRTGLWPRFWAYSLLTAVAVLVTGGLFMAAVGGPWMGLAERISAFAGFQWTFVLAWWMYSERRV
jgi:hypothetical protein